jgi:hypothetical protein
MKTRIHLSLVLCATAGLAAVASANQVITFRSGQVGGAPGSAGQLDDSVTYLAGNNPPGGAISLNPFTAAEFAGAAAGPKAYVINAHPAWTPVISDAKARWINWAVDLDASGAGTGYGSPGSALYAVPLFVAGSGTYSATLTIELAADDTLGDYAAGIGGNPFSLYMNGTALSFQGGNYATPTTYSTTVTVNGGATNYLYLYQRDMGILVSGTIFSGTLDVVPTPGSLALLGLGAMTFARRRR